MAVPSPWIPITISCLALAISAIVGAYTIRKGIRDRREAAPSFVLYPRTWLTAGEAGDSIWVARLAVMAVNSSTSSATVTRVGAEVFGRDDVPFMFVDRPQLVAAGEAFQFEFSGTWLNNWLCELTENPVWIRTYVDGFKRGGRRETWWSEPIAVEVVS